MGLTSSDGPILREILEELKKLNNKVDQLVETQSKKDIKDRLEKTVQGLKKNF